MEVVAATDSASTSDSKTVISKTHGAEHNFQPVGKAGGTCSRPMHAARMR